MKETPFVAHTTCALCNQMYEIKVPAPLSATMVLQYALLDLGGLCPKCLQAEKQQRKKEE